jgi:hypothetical protein
MCKILPMRTSTCTTSLLGMGLVFPLKETHFYSCLLQVSSSLRIAWAIESMMVEKRVEQI